MEDRAGVDKYFASIVTQLKFVDSKDPLVSRWSAISGSSQGLHFICALIDRVHIVGRLIRSQHEKILTLRATNEELKLGANQELLTATEHRAKEWKDEVKKSQTELESLRNQWRELEQEVGAEGSKVVTAYKASRGFELGLEKMGRVNYEFGYRVALEQLRGKHLEIAIEQDPIAECPDDANVEMDLN
ncbi:hypothetical protein B296_00048282 [Ensete ventricosum]|uniref:Uncharacterized protein n=1 Tax=Ensete ventricosum TaxID=4639 RepID=A0A426Y9E0_ENSVE|nr:hypothetical protein B296_00048282 [Ensete ventricosum]